VEAVVKRGLVSIGCLFACSAPEPSGSEGTTDSVRTSEASSDGRPRVRSPAEAVDEAPDDAEIVRVSLIAAPYGRGWAYNQQVPGPTLRLVVGQTLEVRFSNDLPDPTTIHWHGLHVPFEMDGATWMHDPIPPGGEFLYTFRVDQPGTFWYHPHFDTARQVDLGLYGAIVVEDPQEPPVDHELVAILDS
jgi:FtsP/CotA-like multicopper oxidase with cupredoxin domain